MPLPGAAVTWASSDASVVTVDGTGLVTAVGDGSAMVTATSGSAQGSATVTVSQAATLMALYHSTGGPDWTRSDNWGTDAPLGAWFGVETDASGRVTKLAL
uniref:Ig-like domain-containing protein n=1 Tax=Candidatus Palauibacter sp. TaxID=3101350 RepID=UPI003B518ACB